MAEATLPLGSISTADGSSLVRLGDTTVVCGVKAEIAEPDLDAPEDGFLGIASIRVKHLAIPNAVPSPKSRPFTALFPKI